MNTTYLLTYFTSFQQVSIESQLMITVFVVVEGTKNTAKLKLIIYFVFLDGLSGPSHMLVVGTCAEDWDMLLSCIRQSSSSEQRGPHGDYDVTLSLADREVTLLSTASLLNPELRDEEIFSDLDSFTRTALDGGLQAFLLVIRAEAFGQKERRAVDVLRTTFGDHAFSLLLVVSMATTASSALVQELDEGLLELVDLCDGRFCRLGDGAVKASDQVGALLDMADFALSQSSHWEGYTSDMYGEARQKRTQDAAVTMLREKLTEAEAKEREAAEKMRQHEETRAKEMEEMRRRHAEEREKEEADRKEWADRKESCAEAVRGYKSLLELSERSAASVGSAEKGQTTIVLLGLSGSGKTLAADIILTRAASRFPSSRLRGETRSSTECCEHRAICVDGHRLVVVDTPELWDEDDLERLSDVRDCLALALPGPHAFILVMQVGRFTQGETLLLNLIQQTFGGDICKYLLVLFTRDDPHGNLGVVGNIDSYVANAHPSLQEIVRLCGSRYHALNHGSLRNPVSHAQVRELLGGVRKLAASHGGRPYVCPRFSKQELEERRRELEEEKKKR
ncbi:hypothetical protein ACEWY4_005230 [Coilia grayii]|uniref:AIG1-type G domain-containing protein n=1 Tax=Coilia grayii TaxID=363190 RepID=A0ABD1KI23_9TELE